MSKHTPGQWFAEYDDNGFFYINAKEMPLPYVLATGGEGDVDRANAVLASAAPQLLEALQSIIELGRKDTSNPKYDEYYNNAKIAITKATLI